MSTIKDIIKKIAEDINIDLIGFSSCRLLDDKYDFLKKRKYYERDTEFEERNLKKRINPKLLMNNCKSIISIGISYNTDYVQKKILDGYYGKLSKSSWGIDYHRVLNNKMKKLVNILENEYDNNFLYYVDTGPLIDREIAYESGIGYYGKNCSIINEEYGSFIFLGYILTDMYIEPDLKEKNKCGSCIKCIKSCPTGALEKEYVVDGRKCISYLTQTKNYIPVELQKKMGRQIYGCDICQLVCPKNISAKKVRNKEFYPTETNGYVNLEEIFELSNRQFRNKYGHKSGSWRGRNIFKRNSIISLGNIGNLETLKILERERANKNNKKFEKYIDDAILNIKERL